MTGINTMNKDQWYSQMADLRKDIADPGQKDKVEENKRKLRELENNKPKDPPKLPEKPPAPQFAGKKLDVTSKAE